MEAIGRASLGRRASLISWYHSAQRREQEQMWDNDLNTTAAGVLAEMRSGKLPSGSAAGDLDRLPIIDALRAAVGSEDRDWLLAAVESSDDRLAALAVSMLRRLIDDPVVFSAFE